MTDKQHNAAFFLKKLVIHTKPMMYHFKSLLNSNLTIIHDFMLT